MMALRTYFSKRSFTNWRQKVLHSNWRQVHFSQQHPFHRWRQRHDFAVRSKVLSPIPPLSDAINATVHSKLAKEEKLTVRKIEMLRKHLLKSRATIIYTDYGAGHPNNRAEEEMRQGTRTQAFVGDVCRIASNPPVSSMLLFHIVRKFKPTRCVEMGTSLGISGAYIGSALKINGHGRLVTLEAAESIATIAQDNFCKLGLNNIDLKIGQFSQTLIPTLEEMKPVDFIFVDGHHDEAATMKYFDVIQPFLCAKAIMVFDDINWSDGMKRAWHYVANSTISYNLRYLGVALKASTQT